MGTTNSPIPDIQYLITKPKRPFAVTVLILAVLMFTVLGWFGWLETLRNWAFLEALAVPVLYINVRNGLLALFGPPLVWGLWVGRTWAWYALQISAVLFVLVYWLDRIFIAHPAVMAERWPFAVGFTFFGLVCIFLILWFPKTRRFFSKI